MGRRKETFRKSHTTEEKSLKVSNGQEVSLQKEMSQSFCVQLCV